MGVASKRIGYVICVPGGSDSLAYADDNQTLRILTIHINNKSTATRNPTFTFYPSGGGTSHEFWKPACLAGTITVLSEVIVLNEGDEIGVVVAGGATGDIAVWAFGSVLLGEQNA